jgi:hypothetical protein
LHGGEGVTYYENSGTLPKALRLERTAARMRERYGVVAHKREVARKQPRTEDGRRFASKGK